jgi:hypothetical protein
MKAAIIFVLAALLLYLIIAGKFTALVKVVRS